MILILTESIQDINTQQVVNIKLLMRFLPYFHTGSNQVYLLRLEYISVWML